MKLKIVSYNVKALHYDPENPKGVADRREDVAEVLRKLDGDIIGLQEIDVNNKRTGFYDQIQYLAETLGYSYYHFTPTAAKGCYGHAIMSKYPIKELEDMDFSVQIGEHRRFCRAVIDVEGKELVFYNTHLTTSGYRPLCLEKNKIFAQYQLKELMFRMCAEEGPAILTGDFNLSFELQRECIDPERIMPLNGGKELEPIGYNTRIDNIYLYKITDHYWDVEHHTGVIYGEPGASDHPWLETYIKI